MKKYLKITAITALITCVILTVHYYSSDIYNQLKIWKLVPLPEPLTELYFNNHISLPKVYTKGAKYPFSFTIHNIEYQTVDYRYKITASGEVQNPNDKFQIKSKIPNPNYSSASGQSNNITIYQDNNLTSTPVSDETTELITEGMVKLSQDQYATLSATFSSNLNFSRVKVVVDLVDRNQPIHFWLDAPVTPTLTPKITVTPAVSGTPVPTNQPGFVKI